MTKATNVESEVQTSAAGERMNKAQLPSVCHHALFSCSVMNTGPTMIEMEGTHLAIIPQHPRSPRDSLICLQLSHSPLGPRREGCLAPGYRSIRQRQGHCLLAKPAHRLSQPEWVCLSHIRQRSQDTLTILPRTVG